MVKFAENRLLGADLLELETKYTDNPCILLLKSICSQQEEPFQCPALLENFFQSIRTSVCPAISITPKILWDKLILYLRNIGNSDSLVLNSVNIITNFL